MIQVLVAIGFMIFRIMNVIKLSGDALTFGAVGGLVTK